MAWAAAWLLMLVLDEQLDLANKAMLLVLAAAAASLSWGPVASLVSIVAGVLAFNFAFVPPRGTLSVDFHHHGLLLLAMVTVSGIITALVARLRRLAHEAADHARRSDELRRFGDALREAEDPLAGQASLRRMLGRLCADEVGLLVCLRDDRGEAGQEHWFGQVGAHDRDALRRSVSEGHACAAGDGWPDPASGWILPLRGRRQTHGAARIGLRLASPGAPVEPAELAHAQALCDQLGLALERAATERAAAQATRRSEVQAMRNTLLSAVAHDHRTPLATIISAAGALHDQADRLGEEQRRRLSATIVDEARQLARITDNTLQLARLDTASLELQKDWESIEELVGSVAARLRQRAPGCALRLSIEPGLPLVRCDAVLVVQLIDNLLDNAWRHAGASGPVEVCARLESGQLVVSVDDRGPGMPDNLVGGVQFPRGVTPTSARSAEAMGPAAPPRRGSGVGLTLCQAIARVHNGELRVRRREGGGASVALILPVDPLPAEPFANADRP